MIKPDMVQPILYILMRNDMTSMNPGKACAQASHASNAMVHALSSADAYWKKALEKWQLSTKQGFGTCIVVSGSMADIEGFFQYNQLDALSGIVIDPTYPLKDGEVIHCLNIPTCAWIFGDRDKLKAVREQFELMA